MIKIHCDACGKELGALGTPIPVRIDHVGGLLPGARGVHDLAFCGWFCLARWAQEGGSIV